MLKIEIFNLKQNLFNIKNFDNAINHYNESYINILDYKFIKNRICIIKEDYGISLYNKKFSYENTLKIIFQLLKILYFSEKKEYYFKYIFPQNIYFTEENNNNNKNNNNFKLKIDCSTYININLYKNELFFISPEFLLYNNSEPINQKHIIWSIGMLFIYLYSNNNNNNLALDIDIYIANLKKFFNKKRDNFFDFFLNIYKDDKNFDEIQKFLEECLVINVDNRKSIKNLLQNKIFKDNIKILDYHFIMLPLTKNEKYEIIDSKINYDELNIYEKYYIIKNLKQNNLFKFFEENKYEINDNNNNNKNLIYSSSYEIKKYNLVDYKNFKFNFLNKKNKDELINYIKKFNNNTIPPFYRLEIYNYLLNIDSINNNEEYNLSVYSKITLEEINNFNINKNDIYFFSYIFKYFKIKNIKITNDVIEFIYKLKHLSNNPKDIVYILNYFFETKFLFNCTEYNIIIFEKIFSFYDIEYYLFLKGNDFFSEYKNFIEKYFSNFFSSFILKPSNFFKLFDILILYKINIIYIILLQFFLFLKENIFKKIYQKEIYNFIIKNIILFNFIVEDIINETLLMYNNTPLSFMRLDNEFNEDILEELKKNEFLKNRYWEFIDYKNYKLSIINLDEVISNANNIILINIIENDNKNKKLKKLYSLNKLIENKEKFNNKIKVLIGNKDCNIENVVNIIYNNEINKVCILKGGIEIIEMDSPDLLD